MAHADDNNSSGIAERDLGNTGLKVSIIGLGGGHLSRKHVDESMSVRIVQQAIDQGVTFMDNAWEYWQGESERRMGLGLKGRRDKVVLMTKVCGRDRKTAEQNLHDSLRRLQTVLPELNRRGIAAIGMKSLGGDAQLIKDAGLTAEQCRRYAISLPISTLVCGIESLENLRQDVKIARKFSIMSETEKEELLQQTRDEATDGRYELFKSTQYYDSQTHRDQHSFPPIGSVSGGR